MLENGLRYLKRGLDAFANDDLDFALTDFYCGLEITLKAIVFSADWRMVFDEPGDADLTKLDKGIARTIGADQAFKRLDALLKTPLAADTKQAVNRIRAHRNKLMHFYHPDLANAAGKRTIAADLARGWHALRRLSTDARFQAAFSKHAWQHGDIEAKLLVLKTYLRQAETEVKLENVGVSLTGCEACEMQTVLSGRCLLCAHENISHRDVAEGAECTPKLNCSECGVECVVVQTNIGSRCTKCGATYGAFIQCDYCSTWCLEDDLSERYDCSYQSGCEHCDGNFARLMSNLD